MLHMTNKFISHIVPSIIPSSHNTKCISINTQCISNYFTLKSLLATNQWVKSYNDDPHTKVFIDCLSMITPLDKPTMLHLPAAYRTAIARNLLEILKADSYITNQLSLLLIVFVVLLSQISHVASSFI